ncbi:MAG: DUF6885 family protein [Actinomycetota bacterium]
MPAPALTVTLLPGAEAILSEHQRELPQKNELCGAFWVTLALRALDSQALEQDHVGLAASSLLSVVQKSSDLPPGEAGRTDYVLELVRTDDAEVDSGTSSEGLMVATSTLSEGRLAAVPVTGEWTADRVKELLIGLAELNVEGLVIANSATRFLWGSRVDAGLMVGALMAGDTSGPAPDWNVGHFIGVLGWLSGPGGDLIICADTYPSLGLNGIHVQPFDAMAASLNRADSAYSGGMLLLVPTSADGKVRGLVSSVGLTAALWDNGTPYRPGWAPAK